jgi:hypothetical protein
VGQKIGDLNKQGLISILKNKSELVKTPIFLLKIGEKTEKIITPAPEKIVTRAPKTGTDL